MSLQNRESSYIQSVSNRWDIALPQNMVSISPSVNAFEEAALYIDAADTLTFETAGGQTVTASFAAGFIPVRVIKLSAQTGTANIFALR